MTLGRKIAEGTAAFSVESVISMLLGVLSAALTFRYLPPADYGRLALALTFYATGTIFLDFGLGPVFTAEIARSRGENALGRVKLFALYYLGLQLATGVALFSLYFLIGLKVPPELSSLGPIVGTYLLFTGLTNAGVTLFHSHTLYSRQAAQSVVRLSSRLLLLATLPLWWSGNRLVGVALTYPLMEAATAFVSVGLAWNIARPLWHVPLPPGPRSMIIRMLREQGVFTSLIVPVKKVQEQLPIWILTSLAGEAVTGAFAAAQGGFAIIFSFFRGVETTLFPIVSERLSTDPRLLRATMQRTEKYSLWTGTLAIAGGWLFAPMLVRIIAGEAYMGAVPVFRVMLLYLLVYAFAQIQRPLFYATGQQRALLISYVVNVIEYAILLVVGTLSLGATGAALGWVLSETIIVYFRQWQLRQRDPQLAFDLKALFVINEYDRRLWQRLIQLVQRAHLVRK